MTPSLSPSLRRDIGLKRRYAAERRFRLLGIGAIMIGLAFLGMLLWTVIAQGYTAFWQTTINLEIYWDEAILDPQGGRDPATLLTADYPRLVRNALAQQLNVTVADKATNRDLTRMISAGSRAVLRQALIQNLDLIGTTTPLILLASADIDAVVKGHINLSVPEKNRKVSDQQLRWIDQLAKDETLSQRFNSGFFTFGGSSRPETSGLAVALVGSAYMMITVLLLGVPIGVAAAIYLQEFARKNRFTDLIEVNINNLAAVPSIVYGLLGLAIFINFVGLPRSASLVGGLVLTIMTLPTIVITTRSALGAVAPSIRAAALGLGASKVQMVFGHVLPLALPGILTGTIIGIARALGETAPLLLIGMVAFVVERPTTPLDPATALPVQIYMWANEAERAFVERSSGGIIVLLLFLAAMNVAAVILRRKFEKRW